MKPTGRQLRDTACDLLELEDDAGLPHLALVYREAYAKHPALSTAVELAESFLEYPMVAGLVEMSHHNIDDGVFIYPTGQVWTLREVLRKHRDVGQTLGVKAALELCYVGGNILKEAAENGSFQGVYAHGDLNPQRICLTEEGQIQMIGYGLPQVEVHVHRDDPKHAIHADSLQYCPPERLEGNLEDVDADLYALVLIAVEMITGKALYEGPLDRVLEMVKLSQGPQLLTRLGSEIPPKTLDMFRRALIYDPSRRFTSVDDFLEEVRTLLDDEAKGKTLAEVVERMGKVKPADERGRAPASRKAVTAASTSAFSPTQLRAMAADADAAEAAPKEETRWGKATRRQRDEEEAPAAAAPQPDDAARRRRREEEEEEDSPRRRRRGASMDDADEALVRRRRVREEDEDDSPRRRRRPEGEEAPGAAAAPSSAPGAAPGAPSAAAAPAAPAGAEDGLRRRRRLGEAEPAAAPTAAPSGATSPAPTPSAPAAGASAAPSGASAVPAGAEDGRRRRRLGEAEPAAAPAMAPSATAPSATAPSAAAADDPLRRRRRLPGVEGGPTDAAPPAGAPAAPAGATAASPTPTSTAAPPAAATAAASSAEPASSDDGLRRRRRPVEEEPASGDDSSRRRRRLGGDEPAPAAEGAPAEEPTRRRRLPESPEEEPSDDDAPRRRRRLE